MGHPVHITILCFHYFIMFVIAPPSFIFPKIYCFINAFPKCLWPNFKFCPVITFPGSCQAHNLGPICLTVFTSNGFKPPKNKQRIYLFTFFPFNVSIFNSPLCPPSFFMRVGEKKNNSQYL